MKHWIKTLCIVATIHLLIACASKKTSTAIEGEPFLTEETTIVSPPQSQENVLEEQKTTKIEAKIGDFVKDSDPLIIDTVIIQGNKMLIHVRYGGGCTTHDFELIGSPMLAKSYPPIRGLQLVHRANNDLCLAMVMNIIEVDLKNVVEKNKEGSQIYFSLQGWNDRILHTYSADQ